MTASTAAVVLPVALVAARLLLAERRPATVRVPTAASGSRSTRR